MKDLLNIWEKQDTIARNALKCTCQFFISKEGEWSPHGCGIFVNIDNLHFLFTAAHVMEDMINDIFVNTVKNGLITLDGEISKNAITTARSEDKVDILLIKLSQKTIDLLGDTYEYLNQDEIGINHKILELPLYVSVGYPATRKKRRKAERGLITTPYSFCTIPADQSVYSVLKCDCFQNVIVQYKKKSQRDYVTQNVDTGPDLFGISGSGLWFTSIVKDGDLEKNLVAIMTEWPIENRNYIIGTRIDFFTELIRKKYGLGIEQSSLINIEI